MEQEEQIGRKRIGKEQINVERIDRKQIDAERIGEVQIDAEQDCEKQDRERILSLVADYAAKYHKKSGGFKPGDRILYAARVYDEQEIVNLTDSALTFWLTAGSLTEQLEKQLAAFLQIKYCALVNSGSSANLLAFMALTSPLLGKQKIWPGDEVITVAAGFPTTVSPIIQYGAVPVFTDMAEPGYNIDVTLLEKALSAKTKAVMIAHTLGNPFDLQAVGDFCRANGLWLIEDNCDALGSRYQVDGHMRYTGSVGHISTGSFYPPHHMTMGEGGAVFTSDPLLAKIIHSMRDWGRDCNCPPGTDNVCGRRFDAQKQYGELPRGYDHKYVYSHFGYNLKLTDMQAAIGLAQIKKLPDFIKARKKNYGYLYDRLVKAGMGAFFTFQEAEKKADPSWFGFLLTVKAGQSREAITHHLEKHNIQTRLLFAGNLIRHPCFDENRKTGRGYRIVSADGRDILPVTDHIMQNSFWVGVYPGLTEAMLDYMADRIIEAVKREK